MATVRLTDTAIASATKRAADTGTRIEVSDAAERGLRLRITPGGSRSWVLAGRDPDGRMRRFPLGGFPGLGVAEARRAAQAMREAVRKGDDPIADGRERRAAARKAKAAGPATDTLAALIERYGEQRGASLRSWNDQRKRLRHIFAMVLDRDLSALTRFDLQRVADAHPAAKAGGAGVRYLRPILKWAAARGTVPPELAMVSPPAAPGRRDRVLDRHELAALLPVLRADASYGRLYRFLLLTLARREEAGSARWRDVDFDASVWTIPATNSKNGQAHAVPLSRQALALLTECGRGEPEQRIFGTSRGGALSNHDRATKAFAKASGSTGWSRHDLRRTGTTMLGEMGETPDIVEAALNHVSIRSALAATYNRSRYRPQVAAALQRLADALDGIEAGGAEIVPLRPSAAAS